MTVIAVFAVAHNILQAGPVGPALKAKDIHGSLPAMLPTPVRTVASNRAAPDDLR